jgi:hypothetical protein
LATHVYQFTTNPGIPGQPAINYAGALGNYSVSTSYTATGGTIPTWKFLLSEKYTDSRFGFELIQRGFSAGTIENNFIVCQAPDCPMPTVANPTINYNHMAGAIYWDLGLDLRITDQATLYGRVNDLFNPAPPPAPTVGLQGGGVNNTLYDVVGRMFYLGFRTQF